MIKEEGRPWILWRREQGSRAGREQKGFQDKRERWCGERERLTLYCMVLWIIILYGTHTREDQAEEEGEQKEKRKQE